MRRMKTKEVKDNLSMVLRLLRDGKEDCIVICTGDIPVAEIRLYRETPNRPKLLGLDKKARMSEDFDRYLPEEWKDLA
jgi:antitoxin (DNA-binding transcriptional repressor) of toxin-antitoxin stability system